MDMLFLGTSSGVPTKQRNVTGLALQVEGGKSWYLVDCGEATQHQLQRTPLSVNKLKAIFITHVHGDHCYGLPGLLASAAMSGRKAPLPIIGPEEIGVWIVATQTMTQLFLPFELEFFAVENYPVWQDQHVMVESFMLSHRVPSWAYKFTELPRAGAINTQKLLEEQIPKGEIWGQLQRGVDVLHQGKILLSRAYRHPPPPPRKVVVGGDNDVPELLSVACEDAHVLVHEATYTELMSAKVGPSVQHSSAAQVARFAQAAGVPNLVLTHFSPRYQGNPAFSPSIADIEQEARAHYRGELFLAEDFARYRLDAAGQLGRVGSAES